MIEKIDQIDLDFEQIFDYCNNNEPKVENDVYEEVIGYDSKIRTEWEQKIQDYYSKESTDFKLFSDA